MRTLFLLLLLANLLFLAWTRWVVVPGTNAPVPAARSQPGTTPIKLRHEVPGAESSPQAEAMAGSTEPPIEATCVSIGPFVEPAAVEAAAGRLQRLGFLARSRSSVDEVRVGLWVRVPSLPTPEDAANALAALQAAGLSDAYVVSDGSPGNTVSLGVFGDRARAEQVAEIVRKAGYTPETSDRLRTMDVFWIDIDRQANGGLPALDAVEPEPGAAGLPLEMRACPGAVASGATPTVDSAAEPS